MSAALRTKSTCAHCDAQITFTSVQERGFNERIGWTDGYLNGLVCYSAADFQHVPVDENGSLR